MYLNKQFNSFKKLNLHVDEWLFSRHYFDKFKHPRLHYQSHKLNQKYV